MNTNKLNNTRKVKRNIVKSLATLCLGLLSVCFTACDDDLDVTQAYPFTVEAMPVPKELAQGETAEIRCELVREGEFEKHYMAVVHGEAAERATLTDLLYRDKARKMTFVTDTPAKGVQEAVLDYERVWYAEGLSKVYITLYTGRTHQIRVQFASRGLPLIGERKYCEPRDECPLALFSCELGFTHPATGERMHFRAEPPEEWPWTADV